MNVPWLWIAAIGVWVIAAILLLQVWLTAVMFLEHQRWMRRQTESRVCTHDGDGSR